MNGSCRLLTIAGRKIIANNGIPLIITNGSNAEPALAKKQNIKLSENNLILFLSLYTKAKIKLIDSIPTDMKKKFAEILSQNDAKF